MLAFSIVEEQRFNPKRHVESILGTVAGGGVSLACWEPGQISPNHCHPSATEIYFCFEGGGVMQTPEQTMAVAPGLFVVHPPGEVHEYENGPQRTLLFRVRYDQNMSTRFLIGAAIQNGSRQRMMRNISQPFRREVVLVNLSAYCPDG